MAKLIKKLLLSASVAAGVSTVGAVPAIAADFTPDSTNPYTSYWNDYGYDPDSRTLNYFMQSERLTADVKLYEAKNGQTVENPDAEINDILNVDGDTPGGNIELFASSEVGGDFWGSTVLTGEINGQKLKLSSLNAVDWFYDHDSTTPKLNTAYGANTLATVWFTQLWNSNETWFTESFDNIAGLFDEGNWINSLLSDDPSRRDIAYNAFLGVGGFQAASDPNISYINSDGNDIKIGLAGHDDLASFYSDRFEEFMSSYLSELGIEVDLGQYELLSSSKLQASEVVKYSYGEGETAVEGYLYGFTATDSKLVEQGDGASHSGNYEVTIAGAGVASVPEPSTMIGLMTVGGLLAAAKKKGQSKKEA